MKKSCLKIGAIWIIVLFLAACNASAQKGFSPTEPGVTNTKQIETIQQTATPKPTFTLQPTETLAPRPTATFTPNPAKEVLLQFGQFGGDGGWEYFAFLGRDTPDLILYTDGQLIIKKEDPNGIWFEETKLTVPQICSFLSKIDQMGFFDLKSNGTGGTDDPLYQFDSTTQFSEGGPAYVIQVNGTKHKQIDIYYNYVPYLIPKARQIFSLFSHYSPPSKLANYQAQFMLLRIEKGLGDFEYPTPPPAPQTWPTDLPSLDALEKEKVETEASTYFNNTDEVFQVLIQGQQIKPIFQTFGDRLAYKLFQSGDNIYNAVARPLLPHETLNDFSSYPQDKEFNLPFSCK
jgi:hypothetical protein